MTVFEEIHASLLGHPPTSGGSNSVWPIPEPEATISFDSFVEPRARAAWTMNSVGDLTSARYVPAARNSSLVNTDRSSVFMS